MTINLTTTLILVMSVLLLSNSKVEASWQVEKRLFEDSHSNKSRFYPHLYRVTYRHSVLIEGAGVKISHQGVDLHSELRTTHSNGQKILAKNLELQLGYITKPRVLTAQSCPVRLSLNYGEGQIDHNINIPLKSMDPDFWSPQEIKKYDFLMPSHRFSIPPEAPFIQISLSPLSDCSSGELILFNPLIWSQSQGKPGKRFILLIHDGVSGDWLKKAPHLFKNALKFYGSKQKSAVLDRAISPGSNTFDTTLTVFNGKYNGNYLRFPKSTQFKKVVSHQSGLVPMFLEQGYEAISFSSNYLMSSSFAHTGFRNLVNLDIHGSSWNHHHAEVLTQWLVDWLERHPEHDVFFAVWFDVTHAWNNAPHQGKWYKDKDSHKVYPQILRRDDAERMAKAISYLDTVLEPFYSHPLIRKSDVIQFSDHGVNFDTLGNKTDLWGSCGTDTATANWHLFPVSVRVPFFMRSQQPIRVQSKDYGLMNLLAFALHKHNPALSYYSKLDHSLENGQLPNQPHPMIFGHGGRMGVITQQNYFLYSPYICKGQNLPTLLDYSNKLKPTPLSSFYNLQKRLAKHQLIPTQKVSIHLLNLGGETCTASLTTPGLFFDQHGNATSKLTLKPKIHQWLTKTDIFIPFYGKKLEKQNWNHFNRVTLSADQKNCLFVDTRYVTHPISSATPSHLGYFKNFHPSLQIKPKLKTSQKQGVFLNLQFSDAILVFSENSRSWVNQEDMAIHHKPSFNKKNTTSNQVKSKKVKKQKFISKELKSLMKAWGYIQSEDE